MVKIKSVKCDIDSSNLESYNQMCIYFESKLKLRRGNNSVIHHSIKTKYEEAFDWDLEYTNSMYINVPVVTKHIHELIFTDKPSLLDNLWESLPSIAGTAHMVTFHNSFIDKFKIHKLEDFLSDSVKQSVNVLKIVGIK